MLRSAPLMALARRIALLAMLLPFAASALLAQGVMPQAGRAGEITLVLCTGDGPLEVSIDLATGQPTEPGAGSGPGSDNDHAKDPRCAWAQAPVAALEPGIVALPSPPAGPGRIEPIVALKRWHPSHDARGHWPRGPPPDL